MSKFKFDLGQMLRDQITGFTGIAVSRSETITEHRSYAIQPRSLKKGDMVYSRWIDEEMLISEKDEKLVLRKTG